MTFEQFFKKSADIGFYAHFVRKRRWMVQCGKYSVNFFPMAREKFVYVYRADSIVMVPGGVEKALEVALNPPPPPVFQGYSRVPRAMDYADFRKRALEKDPRCYLCSTQLNWHNCSVDHFVPLSRGGGNDYKNLRLCCNPCNRWKGARIMVRAES